MLPSQTHLAKSCLTYLSFNVFNLPYSGKESVESQLRSTGSAFIVHNSGGFMQRKQSNPGVTRRGSYPLRFKESNKHHTCNRSIRKLKRTELLLCPRSDVIKYHCGERLRGNLYAGFAKGKGELAALVCHSPRRTLKSSVMLISKRKMEIALHRAALG